MYGLCQQLHQGIAGYKSSQKNFAYGKPADRSSMSLPMVNQRQASPSRRLSEDELNFVPQRQQKYIRNPSPMTDRPLYPRASENKYVENDYSNYKRRVQDRFTNAFNPRNQEDNREFSRYDSNIDLDHLHPSQFKEISQLLDDYETATKLRYEPRVQSRRMQRELTPEPYYTKQRVPTPVRYNERGMTPVRYPDPELVYRKNSDVPRYQSLGPIERLPSIERLPAISDYGAGEFFGSSPEMKQQAKLAAQLEKQAKLLETLVENLKESPRKSEEKKEDLEAKMKEFEKSFALKATLEKQKEQLEKMEMLNMFGGPKAQLNPQMENKKRKNSKSKATIELMRQQMLAQQNKLMQTMLMMEMFKQPSNIIPWPVDMSTLQQNPSQQQQQQQTEPQPQPKPKEQKPPVEKPKKRRLRRYLWAIAYPKILDNYAETVVMQRCEEIRSGLAAIKDQTEELLVQHFVPEIEDNMIRWRDQKNLIYEAVNKPYPTDEEITNTKVDIEEEIVKFIKEIFDRTTTASEALYGSPDHNPQAKEMPESFLLYLGNFSMNKVLIPSGFLSLFELRRLKFSPKFSKLIIRGEVGTVQASMVLTMIIFVRILIYKILLRPERVFPKVFQKPQDLHYNLMENMKFISSIIYQGIMDLYYDQLEYVFAEDNEKKIRHVAPAEPLIAPRSSVKVSDEEEVINGLYSKQEIRDRMKTDVDYGALKNIFLNWGETIYGLVERTWETTAAEVKKWKKDPTKKKALEIAKRDPLLKNAVFRAVLRPA